MPCNYSYLQDNFYKRFDCAVSKTVLLKKLDTKVKGSSPNKTFFFFAFAKMQDFIVIYMFAEKICFDVLCTCKKTSLSKIAKLVWRYSDDANGKKLSLNRVRDMTASLTGVSRSTAQKIVEEKKAQDEQQQPKQPPPSMSKVSLDDFDQRIIASMYSLK